MEKLRFVDSHVHFYDMKHPELFYGHWQPDVDPPLIGKQMRKLGERNFLAEDFMRLRAHPMSLRRCMCRPLSARKTG